MFSVQAFTGTSVYNAKKFLRKEETQMDQVFLFHMQCRIIAVTYLQTYLQVHQRGTMFSHEILL